MEASLSLRLKAGAAAAAAASGFHSVGSRSDLALCKTGGIEQDEETGVGFRRGTIVGVVMPKASKESGVELGVEDGDGVYMLSWKGENGLEASRRRQL